MQDNLSELEYLDRLYSSDHDEDENLNWYTNHKEDVYRDQEFNS